MKNKTTTQTGSEELETVDQTIELDEEKGDEQGDAVSAPDVELDEELDDEQGDAVSAWDVELDEEQDDAVTECPDCTTLSIFLNKRHKKVLDLAQELQDQINTGRDDLFEARRAMKVMATQIRKTLKKLDSDIKSHLKRVQSAEKHALDAFNRCAIPLPEGLVRKDGVKTTDLC